MDSATTRRWLAHKHAIAAGTAALVLAGSMAVWAVGKNDKNAADEIGKTAEVEPPPAQSDTVHVIIQTVPPRKAQVKWGRKPLGTIPAPRPLVVERRRDSGPMDLVIRASGFLPVHTRVYTFSDSRVAVKLTPPEEKSKLFGYREEPTPIPDAGVPAAPAAPAAPTAPAAPAAPTAPTTTPVLETPKP
ncbi:MAG TPA: hypothetical protein VF524_11715 [Polyangia bacterium]